MGIIGITIFLLDAKTDIENFIEDSGASDSSDNPSSSTSDLCTVKLYKSNGSTQTLDFDWSIASVVIDGEESFIPYIYFKVDEGHRYRIEYYFNAWEGYQNKPIYYEYSDDLSGGSWSDLSYNNEMIYKGSFSQVLAGPGGLIKVCPGIDGSIMSSSTVKLHMEKYVLAKGFTIEIYE